MCTNVKRERERLIQSVKCEIGRKKEREEATEVLFNLNGASLTLGTSQTFEFKDVLTLSFEFALTFREPCYRITYDVLSLNQISCYSYSSFYSFCIDSFSF